MLADLGAEVIKVEPPRGDPFRRFGRPDTYVSIPFADSNRGKSSVVLDLKQEEGREQFLQLLRTGDVFLSNWRPAVAARLGLQDGILQQTNPRLIRVYVSGYGPSGPLADEPAFDTVIQARSGMTYAMSATDQPILTPGSPVDKLTSIMTAQAVLAGLLLRERDRHGDRIDVSMLDVASYVNFVELFENRTFIDRQPTEARNQHAVELRPLAASDGWLVITPVTSEAIRATCAAVEHPEWADEILAEQDPTALVRDLFNRLDRVIPTRSVDDWLAALRRYDVAAAPCLSMDQHLTDAQVVHNHIYRVAEWEDVGKVRNVRYPALFASCDYLIAEQQPPRLGGDTDDQLRQNHAPKQSRPAS